MERIYTFKDLENIQSFMTSLKRKAKKLKIFLDINENKYVELSEKVKCTGYFSEKIGRIPGILAAATGLPIKIWLPVLVHESCHIDQWYEKDPLFTKLDKVDSYIVDEWLDGKRHSLKRVFVALDAIREMELDCEKRAVEKIKKFNLPIDIGEYIQIANCYVFYHNYLKIVKHWYNPDENPFRNPKIYGLMSKEFYDNYDEIPPKLLKAWKKYKV